MDAAEQLKQFLKGRTVAALEHGLYRFDRGPFTDQRIPPESLEPMAAGWATLAADLVLAEPSAGLVGWRYWHGISWMQEIAKVLDERGVELPITELRAGGPPYVWGVPFAQYPPGAAVTIFCDIHTLGQQVDLVRHGVETNGLRVRRAVALIDRGPVPTMEVRGVPFASVLHLPLPLYAYPDDVPSQPGAYPAMDGGGRSGLSWGYSQGLMS